jgi:hypothetical protein
LVLVAMALPEALQKIILLAQTLFLVLSHQLAAALAFVQVQPLKRTVVQEVAVDTTMVVRVQEFLDKVLQAEVQIVQKRVAAAVRGL